MAGPSAGASWERLQTHGVEVGESELTFYDIKSVKGTVHCVSFGKAWSPGGDLRLTMTEIHAMLAEGRRRALVASEGPPPDELPLGYANRPLHDYNHDAFIRFDWTPPPDWVFKEGPLDPPYRYTFWTTLRCFGDAPTYPAVGCRRQ